MFSSIAIVIVFALGTWSGSVAERHFQGTDPGPGGARRSAGHAHHTPHESGWLGRGGYRFVLFRVADIVKPFPANRLERLHGGFGIMADDAMAGVYSNLALRAVVYAAHTMHWTL